MRFEHILCKICFLIVLSVGCDVTYIGKGARGSVAMPQVGSSRVRFPMRSSRTMTLWLAQPLIEMSTTNLPGGKERPACKADSLTAICEPTV
jgi:hypothetical protein